MNKLEQLYAAIKQLEDLGLPVSSEQKMALSNAEKEYVDNELIPLLEKQALELMKCLRQSVRMNLSYDGNNISITRIDERAVGSHRRDPNRADEPKKKKFILKVWFPDGRIVCKNKVSETFIEVVKFAGVDNVEKLGIEILGQNMVSNKPFENERYQSAQYKLDGKLVTTFCDTEHKLKVVRQISSMLGLDLRAELVSINDVEAGTSSKLMEPRKFDRTMYSLEGREFLPKGRFVRDVVAKMLEDNPYLTFEEIRGKLPEHSNNNRTLIKRSDWLLKKEDAQRRYLFADNDALTDGNGEVFYVSTQWTKDMFEKEIIPAVKRLGYSVDFK